MKEVFKVSKWILVFQVSKLRARSYECKIRHFLIEQIKLFFYVHRFFPSAQILFLHPFNSHIISYDGNRWNSFSWMFMINRTCGEKLYSCIFVPLKCLNYLYYYEPLESLFLLRKTENGITPYRIKPWRVCHTFYLSILEG